MPGEPDRLTRRRLRGRLDDSAVPSEPSPASSNNSLQDRPVNDNTQYFFPRKNTNRHTYKYNYTHRSACNFPDSSNG